jgi:hypothetical protein
MKKLLIILLALGIPWCGPPNIKAVNNVTIDGVVKDGVTITVITTPSPVPTPPTPTPTPTPTPQPGVCQSQDYTTSIDRMLIGVYGVQHWYFCIPANTVGMLIQAIGSTLESNAQLTWTFPDGRVFPTTASQGLILGPGTSSVNMRIYGQNTPFPNIPDAYIPTGRHTLTITGNMSGVMSVGF